MCGGDTHARDIAGVRPTPTEPRLAALTKGVQGHLEVRLDRRKEEGEVTERYELKVLQ